MQTATLINDPKLVRIAAALRETFGARLVSALLFGSRARGDHSDYDVAVLLKDLDREKDPETLWGLSAALGEEAWAFQFWPMTENGLADRTTLMFNIRNEATPLPGFEWPTVAAPPITPDEGPMKPETRALLDSARESLLCRATAQRKRLSQASRARRVSGSIARSARAYF